LLPFQLGAMSEEGDVMQATSSSQSDGGRRPGHDQDKGPRVPPDGVPAKDEPTPAKVPPDAIPDLMPGVDPQQTPGIDHPPAEQG